MKGDSTRSDSAARGAAERMMRALPRVLPAVQPIFIPTPRNDLELIGSGVLLRIGPSEFLATAAHVMDQARGQLFVGAESRIVQVTGAFSNTAPGPEGRGGDRFDLAVMPLRESEVAAMREVTFLPLEALDPFEQTDYRPIWGSKYLLLGFPATKQKPSSEDTAHVEPLRYSGRAMPLDYYRSRRRDPATHLMIEYDKKLAWNIDGRITPPDPYGVSGGGLFGVRGWFGEEPESETLVAIPIEYTGRSGKSIIATRVNVLLDGIVQRYPHVAGHIRRYLASRRAT